MRRTEVERPRAVYHRVLGWHAPAMRRAVAVLLVGLTVALVLVWYAPWGLAAILGWDAAAVTFLASVWPFVLNADGADIQQLATREDDTQAAGTILLAAVCAASLAGVGFALSLAGDRTGAARVLLISVAVATVTLSWAVLNTVYLLRYAHLYYGPAADGIDFGHVDPSWRPTYRDFAYMAFTIGMTYQVSDTALRHTRFRRSVLSHALLSYLFGVVIIAGAINLISGLIR